MSRPTLSVVIPNHNGRMLLPTCLASLQRHRPRTLNLEVIVADDASTDGSADWVAAQAPEVRLVRLESNQGFCGSANAGISAAQGEFVQLLNNDTEVCPGWAEAGLAPFDDPNVGSVAPLVLIRSDPSRVDSAGDSYRFFGQPIKRGHRQPTRNWVDRPPEPVFGASASSAFYRAEALHRVGGFDPSFGSYYEDVDLAFRLRRAGYSCIFAPECRILHEVSATYDHGSPALHRRMARNAEALFWTNLPTPRLLWALVPHFGFLALQFGWKLAKGQGQAFLQGKWDALSDLTTLSNRRADRRRLGQQRPSPRFRPSMRPRFPHKA